MLSLPDFKEKQIILCFAAEGQRISFKNDNLVIKKEPEPESDEKEKIILQTTCHKIFSLWIVGHSTITTGLLERSKKFGFSILMLSHSHRPYGIWGCATEGNFLLRRKQYKYEGWEIAKHIVNNKIENQLALLKTIRGKDEDIKDAVKKLKEYSSQVAEKNNMQDILGMEGVASRLFFSRWFEDLNWKSRTPRTKQDELNTLLDIGYTYLFNFVESMLNLYGFDIYQGVYHRCFYQRKSLVCDLVEPFRCIIDKQIKKAYGLNQFRLDDFKKEKNQYYLKIEKNKEYTRWIIQGILEHKENIFLYVQEYYRCFNRDKPIENYPVFKITE